MNDISGLDLGPCLQWYTVNEKRIQFVLSPVFKSKSPIDIQTKNISDLPITKEILGGAWQLYPESARQRSILRLIIGGSKKWFHKSSSPNIITTTYNIGKALSPTAIVPGRTDYIWEPDNKQARIYLYEMDVKSSIATIVLIQTFLHEIAHTLLVSAYYLRNYRLCMPDEKDIAGISFFQKFLKVASKYSPISHYASFYPLQCLSLKDTKRYYINVSEHICESVAAYLLGFTFCLEEDKCWTPFKGRADLYDLIADFLEARCK